MKIFRINNLLFQEIHSGAFIFENYSLTYNTKFRNEQYSASVKNVKEAEDEMIPIVSNHKEKYVFSGDFEIYKNQTISIIFGIIKVNNTSTVKILQEEMKLPKGIYEIRTRRNRDTGFDDYNNRWEFMMEGYMSDWDKEQYSQGITCLFDTCDTCGSDFTQTNVAHSDYELFSFKGVIILFYHHDCNGRGSNGLEFDCFILIYDNRIINYLEARRIFEEFTKSWNERTVSCALKIEIPLYQYSHDMPDEPLRYLKNILKTISMGILREDRIFAPQKIYWIVKGVFKELDYCEHPKNTYNDFEDLLNKIDSPIALNFIISKYGMEEFMRNAKCKALEENFYAKLYQLINKRKLLALKKQDGTFDISEVPQDISNILEATMWSFDLNFQEVHEYESVIF